MQRASSPPHPAAPRQLFSVADFWSFRANTRLGAVGCGEFTASEDRFTCMAVLRQMWLGKLRHLASTDQRMMLTLFGVRRGTLLHLHSSHGARHAPPLTAQPAPPNVASI